MLYFFYKTTNLVNNKVYYGVHSTKTLEDGYLGSGVAIKNAIKKYGKHNFSREILEKFETKEEMFAYEKRFVTEELVRSDQTYNQTIGGFGGFSHINNYGENNPMKDPLVVARCVESTRSSGGYKTQKRLAANRRNLAKASEKNLGKKRPEHSELMSNWAAEYWAQNKEKMRDSLSSYFCLTSPDGVEYRTNRLEEFCKVNDLPYTTIWSISVSGKIPSKGKAKGWVCVKETQ